VQVGVAGVAGSELVGEGGLAVPLGPGGEGFGEAGLAGGDGAGGEQASTVMWVSLNVGERHGSDEAGEGALGEGEVFGPADQVDARTAVDAEGGVGGCEGKVGGGVGAVPAGEAGHVADGEPPLDVPGCRRFRHASRGWNVLVEDDEGFDGVCGVADQVPGGGVVVVPGLVCRCGEVGVAEEEVACDGSPQLGSGGGVLVGWSGQDAGGWLPARFGAVEVDQHTAQDVEGVAGGVDGPVGPGGLVCAGRAAETVHAFEQGGEGVPPALTDDVCVARRDELVCVLEQLDQGGADGFLVLGVGHRLAPVGRSHFLRAASSRE
jgi:hypothetical protein